MAFSRSKKAKSALKALNLDLFEARPNLLGNRQLKPENLTPPAPATLYTKIRESQRLICGSRTFEEIPNISLTPGGRGGAQTLSKNSDNNPNGKQSPTVSELYLMYDRYNLIYFDGQLPRVTIEYSNRMKSAGSYQPNQKLIKIGRKYHELFPEDLPDTLKHEMIHIIHFYHDADFKAEAKRIGATVKARAHPSLRRAPRYTYICGNCGTEYPRQKILRMASCGDCSPGRRYDRKFKLKLMASAKKTG
jgi:predicted SprT family Zn-dependent metalloprotease